MANPLKAFLNLRRDELPLALLMFTYFFSIITTFWILKPLKKAMFVGYYERAGALDVWGWMLDGAQAEQLAKVLNMVVAVGAVILFTALARRMRRQYLTFAFSGLLIACTLGFWIAGGEPGEIKGWLFYLFGDLYNTVMVATFFAFLNDSYTPEAAKRNYGPIVLGGVAGGAFGSTFVRVWVDQFDFRTWMLITVGITLLIVAVSALAGRRVARNPPPETPGDDVVEKKASLALEGARLVFRSRYLLAIVAILGIYELVSTVLDFQFTKTTIALVATEDLDKHFSTVYSITNISALLIQLFLTSYVLNNFRHTVALLVMPAAVLAVSVGYMIVPILWMGAALSISDNALNYSINQSAREALYTPTSRDEKYKAKAFIDMFVQRSAKAVAVGVNLGITVVFASDIASMRYLSIFTIAMVSLWTLAARYAGRRFEEMTSVPPEPQSEPAQHVPPDRRPA